jgi:hypothetical protein
VWPALASWQPRISCLPLGTVFAQSWTMITYMRSRDTLPSEVDPRKSPSSRASPTTAEVATLPRQRSTLSRFTGSRSLRMSNFPRGTQVWVLGYPFEDVKRSDHGQMDITPHPRYLQGYVMRQFDFHWEHGGLDFGPDATLELDLPAPKGVSGSPLLRLDSREIIGMVFGEREAYTLLDEESDDGREIVRGD